MSSPTMVHEAFMWLCRNPGRDAEDLAEHMQIHLVEADDIIELLLNDGSLEFAE